jgi:hypothetical protein
MPEGRREAAFFVTDPSGRKDPRVRAVIKIVKGIGIFFFREATWD